ncbi:MAG: YbaY family lipoprotein, partial [Pseudomonadota bacterium]
MFATRRDDDLMHRCVVGLLLGSVLVTAAACQRSPDGTAKEVSGTATYQERIALPAEAELQVSLIDTESPDAAGPVLAEFSRLDPGNPPYVFTLPYLEKSVDPDHSYGVSAEISAAGETLFYTPSPVPVLTDGH